MKKIALMLVTILFFSVQLFGGSTPPPDPEPVNNPVHPMFDKFVALGDSLTHGFQSGAVDETRQDDSFPRRLAVLMETNFGQGYLEYPGFMANFEDYGKGNISWLDYPSILAGTSGQRKDDYADQDKMSNFGVTGADISTIQDCTGSEGGFYERVLGPNGASALDQALAKDPTFMTIFLGNNDNLGAALGTDMSALTSYDVFSYKFQQVISRVAAKSSIQGVVIATLPDATAIPYLTPVENSSLTTGSLKPFWLSSASSEDEVLDPQEINTIKARVAQFNQLIKNAAAANGWGVFDAQTFFNDIKDYGYTLKDANGNNSSIKMTADFLGGLFSLDGVHMSSTGYAVAANCFAKSIEDNYGINIGKVDEYDAAMKDTLYTNPYDIRDDLDSWYGGVIEWMIGLFM
jgi:lysophospholipase L1-like esterase